ncbi:MAG: phenylalanine--tRNA ligase subunit beta [Granulosicoccaceae bacterium]
MKFSEKWLREWVNPAVSTDELAEQLTLLGLEVDDIEYPADLGDKVVVARIVSIEKHPDADKLRVCQVDAGSEQVQIVCGAANAAEGLVAPLALPGAKLPGGIKIRKSKLRGVESGGMLCSAVELGMAEESDGLMPLPKDAPVGTPVAEYLQLDDCTIEIDLTPNRGDCLSIRGVAYDVAATNAMQVSEPATPAVAAQIEDVFPVSIQDGAGCVRFAGRVLRDVNCAATTPLWMVEKLRRSGIRSISPVVDVTAYVMLELGQPTHAYDLDKLQGAIEARNAGQGEKVVLLDGRELALDSDTLCIADSSGPIGIAGVMGGDSTGVQPESRNVFLEAALFDRITIAGKSRRYNAFTDAAARFERGVDPELQERAIERMTALIGEICGAKPGPVVLVEQPGAAEVVDPVPLRRQRIEQVLGMPFSDADVEQVLGSLGIELSASPEGWTAVAPSRRYDIRIEEDLIEELARVYGFHRLPRTSPTTALEMKPVSETDLSLKRVRQVLVERGYLEAISYSFVDPALQQQINPGVPALTLANPIASDLSEMRTSLWPGLLQAVQRNHNRQQPRVRLFEVGLQYHPSGESIDERKYIAGAVSGEISPESWQAAENSGFFSVKGDLEALLALAGSCWRFEAAEHPALHPGRCARILRDEIAVGWIGELHPKLKEVLDLSTNTVLFEVEMSALATRPLAQSEPLARFPSLRRDLAVLVPQETPAQAIVDVVRAAGIDKLIDVMVFDTYAGQGVPDGQKSIAFCLILQDFSRTLVDADVSQAVANVLEQLSQQLGASLRES